MVLVSSEGWFADLVTLILVRLLLILCQLLNLAIARRFFATWVDDIRIHDGDLPLS